MSLFLPYIIKDAALISNWYLLSAYFLDGQRRLRKILIAVFALLMAANAAVGSYFYFRAAVPEDVDMYMDFISFGIYTGLLFSAFSFKKRGAVFLSLFCYNFITEMFYSLLSPCLPEGLVARAVFYDVLYIAVSLILFVYVRCFSSGPMPSLLLTTPKWVFVAIMIFCLACYYRQFGVAATWYEIIYSLSAVLMMLCIFFFIANTVRNTAKLNEVYKRMNELSDYCDSIAKSDDELRAFRHDYRNHMQVVSIMLNKGMIAEAEKYIKDMNGSTISFIKKYSSGNTVLDSILSSKAALASKFGTEIIFSGYFPPEGIDNNDVCTVAANLIDNAVEASGRAGGGNIVNVSADLKKGAVVFSVKNKTDSVESENGEYRTVKSDKRNHGFGIKNVKKTAEKYGGYTDIEADGGEFKVTVVMNIVNADRLFV